MGRFFGKLRQSVSGRLVLLLMGLLVFMAAFIVVGTAAGLNSFHEYIDVGLLLWLTLLFIFVMLMTGIWKDFVNGFRMVFGKRKNVTRMELQMAAKALESARRLVVLESVIAVALYMVDLLYHMDMPLTLLGPLLALILLSIAYSSIFILIVIPMKVRLENMAISYMEEVGDGKASEGEQDSQTVYFRLRAMGLTDREAEVARLVCCGLANKEIGQMLYISDTTVKKHMTHILEKTRCESREALTELVMKQDLRGRQSEVTSDSV